MVDELCEGISMCPTLVDKTETGSGSSWRGGGCALLSCANVSCQSQTMYYRVRRIAPRVYKNVQVKIKIHDSNIYPPPDCFSASTNSFSICRNITKDPTCQSLLPACATFKHPSNSAHSPQAPRCFSLLEVCLAGVAGPPTCRGWGLRRVQVRASRSQ